jgi:hypothetical protein
MKLSSPIKTSPVRISDFLLELHSQDGELQSRLVYGGITLASGLAGFFATGLSTYQLPTELIIGVLTIGAALLGISVWPQAAKNRALNYRNNAPTTRPNPQGTPPGFNRAAMDEPQ